MQRRRDLGVRRAAGEHFKDLLLTTSQARRVGKGRATRAAQ